jgi:L-asparaginase / beta-aspartyl-peptidase
MAFGIIVHGGAGIAWPDEDPQSCRLGVEAAARAGYEVLQQGGSALDAVEAAVVVLENDPNFNAGTGATLTRDGTAELDASIMDGATGKGGAVATVRTVKNPVRLARAVMEKTTHLLLAGDGAEAFARAQGFPEVANAALITNRSRARWKAGPHAGSGGTVGAAACDAQGRVAAATSTGGTFFKLPGRVGDTPILGAGTWAQPEAAVSCTGQGEAIILSGLARFTAEAIARGDSDACRQAVARLAKAGGDGGVIAIDSKGRPSLWFDTQRMAFAHLTSDSPSGGERGDSPSGGERGDSPSGGERGDSPSGGERGDSPSGGERGDSPLKVGLVPEDRET